MKLSLPAASGLAALKMPAFLRIKLSGVLWFFGILLTGMVSGALTAVGGTKAVAVIAGAVLGGLALAFLSLDRIFICQVVLIYLVVGQMQYFAHISKAFWIPYLLGAALLITLPMTLMGRKQNTKNRTILSYEAALVLFLALLISATLFARPGLLLVMLSVRDYLFLWGFYILIATGLISLPAVDKFWQWLPWLVPVQFPVVMYQRFVVAKNRVAQHIQGASFDAVVGLFGGDPEAGGASGAMGIFIVFAILLVISQWRAGLTSTGRLVLVAMTGLVSIGLAEVKFAIVMLPIGIAILYRNDLLRRPARALFMLLFSVGGAFAILVAYQMQFSHTQEGEDKSMGVYLENTISRQADMQSIGPTGEMGRGTALRFWWLKHGADEPVHFFLGHGVGATFVGSTVIGDATRKYPFKLRRSTLSCLLWESGLLGTIVLCLVLGLASESAWRAATAVEKLSLRHASILRAISAGLLLILFELPYNTDLIEIPSIQFLTIVMLAYVTALSRSETGIQRITE